MNKELFNNNDYLQMTGQDEEYTNMEDSSGLEQHPDNPNLANTYDNIPSVRPVGNGPVPKVPMEVVPMIQLESISEPWDGTLHTVTNELPSDSTEDRQCNTETTYLNMGSSPEKYDLDEYDSVFIEQKVANKVPHINGDCSSEPLLSRNHNGGNQHDFGNPGGGCMHGN